MLHQPAERRLTYRTGLLFSQSLFWPVAADNKSIVDSNGARQYVAAVYFVTLTITTVCRLLFNKEGRPGSACWLGTIQFCPELSTGQGCSFSDRIT